MASSSSSSSTTRCWKYDVFPSFSGEDVRQSFLSHLLKELHRIPVTTFLDQKIERSRLIASELLLAIQESRISIVVFSKNYASSTWCLNELLEIHRCCEELGQMVFPIFYKVDPSHVRKQTGEFGVAFENTCKDKTEDDKQRWSKVLAEVASIAGEHSQNWSDEAAMIEQISKDLLNKLFTPSDDFAYYVGIEAHIKAILDSKLCLKSKEARMVGIVGTSGIGKTTIARALYNRLSSQFTHHVFGHNYKRPIQDRKTADYSVKLGWANKFLSDILCHKDIKINSLDDVKKRLEHRKVLIVLDDVDELELLQTLVGQTEWFGSGSRIVVVTQDRALLKSHNIDVIYEVELPSEDLALEIFCRSAFREDSPPDGFRDLAVEVTKLAGYLPLAVTVLGSSFLGERKKEEWIEMMPRLRDGLDGKIEKTLKVSYDGLDLRDHGLDLRDQDIFLHIACLFNGEKVNHIKNMLGNDALRILAERSLIRIIKPSYSNDLFGVSEVVEMHGLLEKFGREIVRVKSIDNPEKRRFLMDAKDICDVFTDHNTGKENVVGIHLNTSRISKTIDEKAFVGMRNLRFLKVYNKLYEEVRILFPQGVIYLPPKLRLLHWHQYPAKSLPFSFNGEYLVELIMENSRLEKLWEGTKPLQNLKKMILSGSEYLKEIPNLSNATSLEILDLSFCISLVELPSSIWNLIKLTELSMLHCSKLKVLPTDVNLESLDFLDLMYCESLESFPQISRNIARLHLRDTAIKDYLWIENLSGLAELVWDGCLLRCMPSKFHTEHLVILKMKYSKLEKLWDGVQPLQNLKKMELNWSTRLKEIPDLSNATNLEILDLSGCTSLVALPSSIQNLKKLIELRMDECLNLKFLPVDVNLESLNSLRLKKCSRLQTFPWISRNISWLYLDGTAMTKKDCLWFKNFSRLTKLEWKYCPLRYVPSKFHTEHLVILKMRDSKLEKLWEGDQPLENLELMDLSRSKSLKEIPNLSKATNLRKLYLNYCTGLVALPPSIQYLDKLEVLEMIECTSLEVLPTNIINLVSLNGLNLYGCSRLTSIPKISTSIKRLCLDYTAIEEVPWIENIAGLTHMSMSGCKKLRKIPATFMNLGGAWQRWDFRYGQRKVKVSNASLVKTLVELHPARIEYYTETLTDVSYSTTEFLLARDAQEYIPKLDFIYGVIPGDQVPTYFTHRDRGASLSVPLPEPESSLSTKKLAFAACINLDRPIWFDYITIFVHWKLGGVKGICRIIRGTNYHELDHQLVFHFDFENREEFDDPPSQLEFEFEAHRRPYYFCGCYTFGGNSNEETCTIPPCNIEECGIRVLSVSPSLYEGNQQDGESDSERESFKIEDTDEERYTGSTSERSSYEPDYSKPDGESDTESERSNEIEDSQKSREEIDAESGGSKQQLQMAVITSQEPSNLPSGQFPVAVPAPNLELSLGLSRVSRHFHGDETALNHSLPPSYPFLEAEALYFDPMIAEHDDTETISPQLINFSREEADAECGGSKQQLQTTVVTLCGQTAVDTGLMASNLEFSLRLCGASESSDHVSFRGKLSSPSISMDANETENNQPNGESDAASERSKKRKKMTVISFQEPSSPPCGQTVETGIQYSSKFPSLDANVKSSETEGGRSKKRMQMTVVTSQEPSNQEPSNQPGSQSLVPKLDLSSGLCGASSSLPGDGTSLNPCLEKEALDDDLMVTEQLDTEEKPSVKPSFTSWFPNIFRFWK